MNPVLIGVLVYVVLQLLVGLVVSRRVRTESDYLIAGRRIGLGLATFTMFATWFGAESCVSAAGKFYEQGLAGGATDPFGYALALVFLGLLIILGVVLLRSEIPLAEAWSAVEPDKLHPFGTAAGSFWTVLELWTMTVCGSLVAQEVIARVLATRSPTVARQATLLGGGLYLTVGLIPAFLGLIGVGLLPGLDDPEQILPRLAARYLPTFLYILFIGALVSAILSTVDSTLLAASSLVAHNFVVSFRPDMPDRRKLLLARTGVGAFGLVAYGLALGADSIFELVQQANGVGSSGILVLVVFGLFTRFGNARAGYATLTVGLAVWICGTYLGHWTCTYLLSLAAAALTYLAAALSEPCHRSASSRPFLWK